MKIIYKIGIFIFLLLIVGTICFFGLKYSMAITSDSAIYTRDETSEIINELNERVNTLENENTILKERGNFFIEYVVSDKVYASNTTTKIVNFINSSNTNSDIFELVDDNIVFKKNGLYRVTLVSSITNSTQPTKLPSLAVKCNNNSWISFEIPFQKYGTFYSVPWTSGFLANSSISLYLTTYDASITYSQFNVIVDYIKEWV